MFEIRCEADFSAAHFLCDYHGKCENLHGHNYKVFAHAKGNTLDSGGMLFDFSILKKVLREVCEELDHKPLNDFKEFSNNPSAEKIAIFIAEHILLKLPELSFVSEDKPYLSAIDVFETETSRARYTISPRCGQEHPTP